MDFAFRQAKKLKKLKKFQNSRKTLKNRCFSQEFPA